MDPNALNRSDRDLFRTYGVRVGALTFVNTRSELLRGGVYDRLQRHE